MIDWTNPKSQVTTHFTVRDLCWLHNWNRLATAEDGVDFDKLMDLANTLEAVRAILGCPMNAHCGFRSAAYNIEQKILLPTGKDVHQMSIAFDFDCGAKLSIEQVKVQLVPHLEALGIRLEFGTTTWAHVDKRAPGPSGRYFHV